MCVCVVFAGKDLENNTVDVCVKERSTMETTRLRLLRPRVSLFTSPLFQGHGFGFRRNVNLCIINVVTIPNPSMF